MTRTVAVVPHTHWDREWYESFQTFRLKLVDLLDGLLPLLEADPSYAHFQLDGQMAVVDDYLAMRPEAERTLQRLAASGRLSMGPWYALPDEFLVSGETMVRNLQLGIERATAFGGAMEVGYLPDMFGHVAQMPQLFRQLGFEHAVVWRGVPSAIDKDAFWWEAPDGSTVRAEYLPDGYGNGAHLLDDAKDLVRRIAAWEESHAGEHTGSLLWMNGTDHKMPQPWLGRVIAEANEIQDDYHLVVTSLSAYLAAQPAVDLPHWTGELRSGSRANLLMGVASNRLDVKQGAARAERALEQLAEPLSALFRPAADWPGALLDEAWLAVIRNSAHDSVCACSSDVVCNAVNHRYAEALHIADGLTERAIDALGASLGVRGPVIVNPSARTRSGLVQLRLGGDVEVGAAAQIIHEHGTDIPIPMTREGVAMLLAQMLDYDATVTSAEIIEHDDGTLEAEVHQVPGIEAGIASKPVIKQLREAGDGDPETPTVLRLRFPPSREVLVRADEVPGYGWRAWEPATDLPVAPVTVEGTTLDNGALRVEVDAADGTFTVNGVAGMGRLVDGGDNGDTYNYNPPDGDRLVEAPERVEVSTVEQGPLRARLKIVATYRWPEVAFGEDRFGEREVGVTTTLELCAGERVLRVGVEFDNTVRDHRLRAHFPLPEPAAASRAECAFTVVERGLIAEGGATEYGLPTFPSRRFVSAGGLTVLHEGLLEYELVDIDDSGDDARAKELALTLVRSTGMLSRPPMRYRPMPAGPFHQLEGAQLQGPVSLRYALSLSDADPYELVDEAFLPLATVDASGSGEGPAEGRALEVRGAQVSAVVRQGGVLTVRVFNPTGEPTVVEVPGRRGWLVDLRGRPVYPFEGSFPLAAQSIATAQLSE
jgi:hypothetical protein